MKKVKLGSQGLQVSKMGLGCMAADIRLTQEELAFISREVPRGTTAGNRYPDMSTVNR